MNWLMFTLFMLSAVTIGVLSFMLGVRHGAVFAVRKTLHVVLSDIHAESLTRTPDEQRVVASVVRDAAARKHDCTGQRPNNIEWEQEVEA